MNRDYREPRDEIDGLFSRLEPVEPPVDLAREVFNRTTRAHAPARRLRPEFAWGLADFVALMALAVLSVSLGWTLVETGGLDVLGLLVENPEIVGEAQGELLPALVEALPWLHLVALVVDLAVIYVASHMLVGTLGVESAGRREVSNR